MALQTGLIVDFANQFTPEIFGNVNPNNDVIFATFGDQGGY